MIPIGYMAKRVSRDVAWLKNEAIEDIYALSGCISTNFAAYVDFWKHNGFWLFDSPAVIRALAASEHIDLSDTQCFYYEAYEREFDEEAAGWNTYDPEPTLKVAVEPPTSPHLEGFDIVTFSQGAGPECSPLSCNGLAETVPVNRHCLINTLDDAKGALEQGRFANSEPGPFRIIAVYTVGDAVNPALAPRNRTV